MWHIVEMKRNRILNLGAGGVMAVRRLNKPKHHMAIICLVTGLVWLTTAISGLAQTAPSLPPGVQDVVKLVKAGLGEEVGLAHIKNPGATYTLSADQIIYVHQQGVSENEMRALMGSGSPNVPASPAPVPTPAPVVTTPPPAQALTAPAPAPAPPPPTYAPVPSAPMVPMAPTVPAPPPASLAS